MSRAANPAPFEEWAVRLAHELRGAAATAAPFPPIGYGTPGHGRGPGAFSEAAAFLLSGAALAPDADGYPALYAADPEGYQTLLVALFGSLFEPHPASRTRVLTSLERGRDDGGPDLVCAACLLADPSARTGHRLALSLLDLPLTRLACASRGDLGALYDLLVDSSNAPP